MKNNTELRDSDDTSSKAVSGRSGYLKLFIFALIAITVLVGFRYFSGSDHLRAFLEWIEEQGNWAPVLFMIAYILACVLSLPGAILTLGAGFMFGIVWGTLYVSIASTLGASLAFVIGRYLAREAIQKRIAGSQRFSALDAAVEKEGWKIVLLTRLSPLFPFNLLNYGYGLTRVRLHHYIWASWLGMLPGTVMYVYIGSLAGDLATIGAGGGETSTAEWGIRILGFVATVAVTLYVSRMAWHALQGKVSDDRKIQGAADEI